MKKASKPPTRVNHRPAEGQLVKLEGLAVDFSAGGRKSYYVDQLNKLIEAGPDFCLKLARETCAYQIRAAARKLKVSVLTAAQDGALYVKISRIEAQPAPRTGGRTLADIVRGIVEEAPRTNSEIFDHARQQKPDVPRGAIDTTLSNLRAQGEIAKKDDLKWYLILKRAA